MLEIADNLGMNVRGQGLLPHRMSFTSELPDENQNIRRKHFYFWHIFYETGTFGDGTGTFFCEIGTSFAKLTHAFQTLH